MGGAVQCPHCLSASVKYGVHFPTCVLAHVGIPDPNDAARNCWFLDDGGFAAADNDEERMRWTRNVLYWYFATNIYSIYGSRNRAELPECLVTEIRRLHPNLLGVPYAQYDANGRL